MSREAQPPNRMDPAALEVRQRLKGLMIIRAAVVTVLLGSLAALQYYQEKQPVPAIYLIIIATYFLTIVYAILFNQVKNLKLQAYLQISGDVVLETALVYVTGGIDSAFSFTYIFSIIAAGILLLRRGSFITASAAGICYGLLVDLHYYRVILPPPERFYTEGEIFYNVFLNFVAFYTVALLSSSLSERLQLTREALEERTLDLRDLQALNESIVRSMADGLVTVGLDGRITAFNKAAEEITGKTLSEVLDRHFSEVFHLLGVDTFFDDKAAARKLPCRYELGFDRPDGRLTLGMTLSPLRNEAGEMRGLLGIFQDLTPIKKMEEEIKKKDRLAAIGELSAGMAHEIRNPLASLSGSLQVLRDDLELSAEDRHLMEIALSEMDRLNNIVTQFLIYARPKPPEKKECDIAAIIRDTTNLIANSKDFPEGMSLAAYVPDGPLLVRADPGQMKQVIYNLALNAVQSIGEAGSVTIGAAAGDGSLVVEVRDDGEGVPKEDLDRIFYPFFSTKPGGSGLGLPIVYRIIEDHGGTITVDSGPAGSAFIITLPLEDK